MTAVHGFMVLDSSSELMGTHLDFMQALNVKTADSSSFSDTWLNIVESIWLQLVVFMVLQSLSFSFILCVATHGPV